MGQQTWEASVSVKTTEGSVDEFMNRENSGREILGQALRNSWDWTVRGWILALSPYSYPIKVNYVQWGNLGAHSAHVDSRRSPSYTCTSAAPWNIAAMLDRRPTIV